MPKYHKFTQALLLMLLVPFFLFPSASMEASENDDAKVGIYYYAWYSGDWPLDHTNCIDTPIMGQYNSSSLTVISQHLDSFQELGIDFIIFPWCGRNSPSNNNIKLVLSQIAENYTNFKFFIMVDRLGWLEQYDSETRNINFQAIYDYLSQIYYSSYLPNCFLLDGKPAIGFYDDPSAMLTTNGTPDDHRFSTRVIGCNEGNDWEYEVPTLTDQPISWKDKQISVCPRYDPRDKNGSSTGNYHVDVNYTKGLYDRQWSKAIA